MAPEQTEPSFCFDPPYSKRATGYATRYLGHDPNLNEPNERELVAAFHCFEQDVLAAAALAESGQ